MGGLSVLKEIGHMGNGHSDGIDSHDLLDFLLLDKGIDPVYLQASGFPASSCLTCRDQNEPTRLTDIDITVPVERGRSRLRKCLEWLELRTRNFAPRWC